eukprot:TRINITY_DN15547_c0_g1_i2.p1 TRINITY_DN15547_c0_g1~~TRINITY_DN15547_c0_g1_i2.p1  ORF type:complete len:109 (-),score=22.55 TRINITY_DN15547_c0_g1_i2:197-523(-)
MAIASTDTEVPRSNVLLGRERFLQKPFVAVPQRHHAGVLLGRTPSSEMDSGVVREKQEEENDSGAHGFRSEASKKYAAQCPPDHPAWQAWKYHQEWLRMKGSRGSFQP